MCSSDLNSSYEALQNFDRHWGRIPFKLFHTFFTVFFYTHSLFKFLFPLLEGVGVHGLVILTFALYLKGDFETSPVEEAKSNLYILLLACFSAQCQSRFNWHFDRLIIHLRDIRALPTHPKLRRLAQLFEVIYDLLANMPLIKQVLSGSLFTDLFQLVIPLWWGVLISYVGKIIANSILGLIAGMGLPELFPYASVAATTPSAETKILAGYILGSLFALFVTGSAAMQGLAKWDAVKFGELGRYQLRSQKNNWLATNERDGWLRIFTFFYWERLVTSVPDHFERTIRKFILLILCCSNTQMVPVSSSDTQNNTITFQKKRRAFGQEQELLAAISPHNRWMWSTRSTNVDNNNYASMEAEKIGLHLGRIPGFPIDHSLKNGDITNTQAHIVKETSAVADLIAKIERNNLYFIINPEANETFFVGGEKVADFIKDNLADFRNQQLLVGTLNPGLFTYLKETLVPDIDYPLSKVEKTFAYCP